VTVIYN